MQKAGGLCHGAGTEGICVVGGGTSHFCQVIRQGLAKITVSPYLPVRQEHKIFRLRRP